MAAKKKTSKKKSSRSTANRRPKLPKAVETAVLTKSRRRCCLCYHLNGDLSEKKGQIAHLDQDPSNNEEDNLAFLCFDHHDEYDRGTSQAKGLTAAEVRDACRSLDIALDKARVMTKVRSEYRAAKRPLDKARALEALAAAALQLLTDLEVHGRNLRAEEAELDLVLWNDQRDSVTKVLDPVLVVECKATSRPIDAAAAHAFLAKLRTRGLRTGLLVSVAGIAAGARHEVRRALVEDQTRVLLIQADALAEVESAKDIRRILKSSYADLFLT